MESTCITEDVNHKKKKTRANLSAALCHQAKLVYNSLHSDETHLEITLSQGLTRQT